MYTANDADPEPDGPFDPHGDVTLARRKPSQALQIVLWRSWLFRLAKHVLVYGRPASTAIKASDPDWQRSLRALERMAEFCAARHIGFAVFFYRMLPDAQTDSMVRGLAALADQKGFSFADTLPWFRGTNVRDLTNSRVDGHPNSAAHTILAIGIERHIREKGLVR